MIDATSDRPGATHPTSAGAMPGPRGELLAVLGPVIGRRALVLGDAGGDLTAALRAGGALVVGSGPDAVDPGAPRWDLVFIAADARLTLDGTEVPEGDAAGTVTRLEDVAQRLTAGGCLVIEVPETLGLRHMVTPSDLQAGPLEAHGGAGHGMWGRGRVAQALAGVGFTAQRWWSVLPSLDVPSVLITDDLWDVPGARERIGFLVRDPMAPPAPGRHVDIDPVDAFQSLLAQGRARDLADASLVVAARGETTLAEAATTARLIVAADTSLDAAWATRLQLPAAGWTLEPAAGSADVRHGPLAWRPGPVPLPAAQNGEDVLIAALLEHGVLDPATGTLLAAWWAAALGAMDGPDGRATRLDPGCFGVAQDGTWQLVLPSPHNAFPMPIHLAAYGALVRLLARRLPMAGVPRGAALHATIGEVAADLVRWLELEVGEPGSTLWSVLEADCQARMMGGRVSQDELVGRVRRRRDTTLGELVDGMPVSAHVRIARMAVDAEARVAAVAADLRERERELRRAGRDLAAVRDRAGAAEAHGARLAKELADAEVRIAALTPREAEVELLKVALKDNGVQIRALRAEVAAARERDRRLRAEVRSQTPVEMPLRPPGRVGRARERLRERQTSAAVVASGWFDAAWYLERYPDVRSSGLDPVIHYLRHGWLEGRDPGPRFQGVLYRRRYPDVAVAGIDPLVHHVRHGTHEGRVVPPPVEPRPVRAAPDAGTPPDRTEPAA